MVLLWRIILIIVMLPSCLFGQGEMIIEGSIEVFDVSKIDPNLIIAGVSGTKKAYKTDDGGKNWTLFEVNEIERLSHGVTRRKKICDLGFIQYSTDDINTFYAIPDG